MMTRGFNFRKKKPHIICVGFAETYRHLFDFNKYNISIVMHRSGAPGLSANTKKNIAGLVLFEGPSTLDLTGYDRVPDEIIHLAEQLSAELGPPAAVVALFENNMLSAARLREHFGTPGTGLETTILFRDKVRMKEALQASGIQLPLFWPVGPDTTDEQIDEIVSVLTDKVVLKPRSQAASIGIEIFETGMAFRRRARAGLPLDYEVEEFVEGTVCHFDGVIRNGTLLFFSASRYIGNLYDFRHRAVPMGTITFDNSRMVAKARDYTEIVLHALGLRDSTFHLEAFLTEEGEFVFLEVASRFSGGGVSDQIRMAYEVDLVEETILACLGEPSKLYRHRTMLECNIEVGASALVLMPLAHKSRVVVRKINGLDLLPESVIHSETPHDGQVLNEGIDVWPISGRFILVGNDSTSLESDMRKIMEYYSVEVEDATQIVGKKS